MTEKATALSDGDWVRSNAYMVLVCPKSLVELSHRGFLDATIALTLVHDVVMMIHASSGAMQTYTK